MFQIARSSVDVQEVIRKSGGFAASVVARDTKTRIREKLRIEQRGYLREVLAKTGLTASELARAGDMHPSTLTRFLNDTGHKGALAPLTLSMIADRTGIPVPATATTKPIAPRAAAVLKEREAERYEPRPDDPLADAIRAYVGDRDWIDAWVLRSRALEYEGFRAGDILLVDTTAKPAEGDIVCAQLYDWQKAGGETVFRLYQPPILIGAGPEESARRPRFADDPNVAILGAVLMSFRRRQERAAA